MMRALILAAGRGSRMGEKTAERPKCLLEVGGRALIEHQLEALADCGVGPVGIVVGYFADEIREVVGYRAEFVENTAWRRTNSLYSFWLAREWAEGPILVLNSDLLLDPKILETVVRADGDTLAFDSGSGTAAEQMKLEIRDGLLVSMSKSLPAERAAGENVGVLKFEERSARRLFDLAGELIEAGGENDWLGSAVSKLASERPLRPVDVAGLSWAEIDFPYDLERARKEVWPALRANRRARWWPRRLARGLAMTAALVAAMVTTNLVGSTGRSAEWETRELFGLEPVRVVSDTREERWWELREDQSTTLRLAGPAHLRVESRLAEPPEGAAERYAVEAALNGVPLKWKDQLARPSKSWRVKDQPVGKRHDFEVELPEGEHTIRLRVIAEDGTRCLVRVAEKIHGRAREED